MNYETVICPTCHQPVTAEWFFCPNCGKNLKEKPPSTTWLMQTGLYLLAVLLTPLGLWPGIKYLRSHDAHARRVGIIVVVLTSLSFIISIWLFSLLFGNAFQQANSILNGSVNF
ncbi:MAG: zinc ribbon domain-containing protein [Patescibacteria group bacterium]